MDDISKAGLEELFQQMDLKDIFKDDASETDQVNHWISKHHKLIYKELQYRSNKKFGKSCQKLLELFIEKAYLTINEQQAS